MNSNPLPCPPRACAPSLSPLLYVRVTARPTPVLDGGSVDADFPLAEALPFDMDSEPAAARDPILANGLNG